MDFHNGYFVKKCEKIESLSVLKLQVCNLIREEFNIECDDDEKVLNQFHEFVNEVSEVDFNEKRMLLIKKIITLKLAK